MTTNTTTRRPATDSWSLQIMREAAAFRAANPDPEHTAADAFLDAYLAECEAAANEVGITPAGPDQARSEAQEQADRPTPGRGGNATSTHGGNRNAPSEAQLRFLASLARDLGHELQTPRDKSHASLIIDSAKKALDKMRREGAAPARPARPATERQIEYVTDLLATRVHELGDLGGVEGLTFEEASRAIETLRNAPRAKRATPAHGIREGRYAFQPEPGAQAQFYIVARDGKLWVQAGPARHPYNGKLNEGLEAIKADPRAHAALYGQLIGCCGRCGRDLTDKDSQAAGLGPYCAGKSDW